MSRRLGRGPNDVGLCFQSLRHDGYSLPVDMTDMVADCTHLVRKSYCGICE